jgi:putative SOS response-associated peptidase YedK
MDLIQRASEKDGPAVELDTYAFLTSKPNTLTEPLGHGRMPVLLSGHDDYEQWLYGSNDLAM